MKSLLKRSMFYMLTFSLFAASPACSQSIPAYIIGSWQNSSSFDDHELDLKLDISIIPQACFYGSKCTFSPHAGHIHMAFWDLYNGPSTDSDFELYEKGYRGPWGHVLSPIEVKLDTTESYFYYFADLGDAFYDNSHTYMYFTKPNLEGQLIALFFKFSNTGGRNLIFSMRFRRI